MKLIDKDKLVVQIKKKIEINLKRNEESVDKHDDYGTYYWGGVIAGLNVALMLCDTLEVKDVDLEKEIELIKGDYEQVDVAWNNDFDYIARHFFELGLKAQKGE